MSESLALAALELLVHVDPGDAPDDLVAVAARIPDGLMMERREIGDLPADRRSVPAPPSLTDLGTAWVRRRSTAVLVVPSVPVPAELNYLLNPAHPDFSRIETESPVAFSFDPRLARGRRA